MDAYRNGELVGVLLVVGAIVAIPFLGGFVQDQLRKRRR
jgi:hypothetical protein